MAKRGEVPKFGNWDNDDIPYTVYFGNAIKDKSGGKPKSVYSPDKQVVTTAKHERQRSREEGGGGRRLPDSPLHHGVSGQRFAMEAAHPHHQDGGKQKTDSPLHHKTVNSQGRLSAKGSAASSPSREKKGSSQGSSHGLSPSTPGRSRLRSGNRGNETPDHRAAVPKFGDWDESDPATAENFTQIFNKVREEKQISEGSVTEMYSSSQHEYHNNHDSRGCGCYPWRRW